MPAKLVGDGILDITAGRYYEIDSDGINAEAELTTKEFDLLVLLMPRPDVTIKREEIMDEVRDENGWGSTRTLDTHASTLRRKIHNDTESVVAKGDGVRILDANGDIITERNMGDIDSPYRLSIDGTDGT
jgi:DNA-binding response OmpR family regulator